MMDRSATLTRTLPLAGIVAVVVGGLLVVFGTGPSAAVTVRDAWMAEPANPTVAGVFMVLTNEGTDEDRLVGGATGIADIVEIHETVTDEEGRTQMHPLTDGLALPPGTAVALEPGGYHVMLREVTAPPAEGGTVTITLAFAEAGTMEIDVPVRAPMTPMHAGTDEMSDGGTEG